MSTREQIEQIENDVYSAYLADSRPAGAEWVCIVLDLARQIMATGSLADEIGPETVQELQTDNHHTASEAVKIILNLRGRA